jgi:hypothetical protein
METYTKCAKENSPELSKLYCENKFDKEKMADATESCMNNYCDTCCSDFFDSFHKVKHR